MRRIVILAVVLFACLLWLDSPSRKRRDPTFEAPAAVEDLSLRDLIPASALLAVEVHGLEGRWPGIGAMQALAGLQDLLVSCAGIGTDLVPKLVGDRAILLLEPSDSQPCVVPIAILRPRDVHEAEGLLSGIEGLSCRRGRSALWVGPAGAEQMLERLAREGGPKLSNLLPFEEMEARLPSGGLIRGWLNPGAWVELLRDSRIDTSPAALRWAAAALRAEFTTVRYVAFRRDFADGEVVTNGLVAYDPARLPPEVLQIFNPEAPPAVVPPDLPPDTLAVVGFRTEAHAWMPWLRHLAAADSRGPLRNLGFWVDEFNERYQRDLDRDLFGAFGDYGWLLVRNGKDAGPVESVMVLEIRQDAAVEGTLADILSWTAEQVWLGSFGAISSKSWHEGQPGHFVGGVTFQTPFSGIPGPDFQLENGYLFIAGDPESMRAGKALAESLRRSRSASLMGSGGAPAHISLTLQGAKLAELIRASRLDRGTGSSECLYEAIAGLADELESLKVDMTYEQDAIRFLGRVRFSARKQFALHTSDSNRQMEPRQGRMESPLSILLSSARAAATWGVPAALFRQLQALHPRI